ncbi:MAG TPA: pseudouridine synthase [Terriglobales bacterium]|nr:pseudouridine synthase [Terriglobales bacterium]
MKRVGLARALSKLGYCSRSQAAGLIRGGRVTLNGQVARDPEMPVRMERDRIAVDGSGIRQESMVYLMMNKPRGVVTTASDERGRRTIYDLLEADFWVGPVGRLDKASEGLLLLTNDSEWAARITDPAGHVDKRYHVQIDRVADDSLVEQVERGIEADGVRLRAKAARILRLGEKNSWLEVTLDEGKNRQIRRMLAALDIEVLRLVRVAVGPLELSDLKKGGVRALTAREKARLDDRLATRKRP